MTSALFGRVSALLALSIAVDTFRYIRESRYGFTWVIGSLHAVYVKNRSLWLGIQLMVSCVMSVFMEALRNELDMFCMRRNLL